MRKSLAFIAALLFSGATPASARAETTEQTARLQSVFHARWFSGLKTNIPTTGKAYLRATPPQLRSNPTPISQLPAVLPKAAFGMSICDEHAARRHGGLPSVQTRACFPGSWRDTLILGISADI